MSRLRDKYQLGARIGGGGMAEVLHATAIGVEGFARPVAIKRVLPALSRDPSFGAMFISEARLASLLHHPNVVSVLDFDRDDDGTYFLVMELVQGIDLRRLLDSGALPAEVAAHVVGEVLRGLSYAHELLHQGRHLGIVHRDISPHNVMVSWDGSVKVVDFGIAKAVRSSGASLPGALKGKVAYMSPEQAQGHPLDGRSDLFAVGVMFHEMLSGARLFRGADENEVLSRLLSQPIATPPGPSDFAQVCMRLLAREPRDRFRSARSALEALLSCASTSARAGLALQEILRARFPDRAPRIPTGVRTQPERPSARTPAAAVAPAPPVPPRTITAPTPTVSGQTRTRTGVGHRSSFWVVGGASFLAAAGIILYLALARGGGPAGAPDAGAPIAVAPVSIDAAPPIDSAPAMPPVDARPAAAPAPTPRPPPTTRPRVRQKGTLEVRATPWARVRVGRRTLGTTPITVTLEEGSHTLVLDNPALGRSETLRIVIDADEPVVIQRDWTP